MSSKDLARPRVRFGPAPHSQVTGGVDCSHPSGVVGGILCASTPVAIHPAVIADRPGGGGLRAYANHHPDPHEISHAAPRDRRSCSLCFGNPPRDAPDAPFDTGAGPDRDLGFSSYPNSDPSSDTHSRPYCHVNPPGHPLADPDAHIHAKADTRAAAGCCAGHRHGRGACAGRRR